MLLLKQLFNAGVPNESYFQSRLRIPNLRHRYFAGRREGTEMKSGIDFFKILNFCIGRFISI